VLNLDEFDDGDDQADADNQENPITQNEVVNSRRDIFGVPF